MTGCHTNSATAPLSACHEAPEKTLPIQADLSWSPLPHVPLCTAAFFQWLEADFKILTAIWLRAYKNSWNIGRSTAACLLIFPRGNGGLQVKLPLVTLFDYTWSNLERCHQFDDNTRQIMKNSHAKMPSQAMHAQISWNSGKNRDCLAETRRARMNSHLHAIWRINWKSKCYGSRSTSTLSLRLPTSHSLPSSLRQVSNSGYKFWGNRF